MTDPRGKITAVKMVFTLVYLLIFPFLILFLSGDWFWVEGWIFNCWFIVLCLTAIVYLYAKDPELLLERYKSPGYGNQKKWDILYVYAIVVGFLLWIWAFLPFIKHLHLTNIILSTFTHTL